MLASLFRMLTGAVEFTAEGGFPERFINLCSLDGVPLNGLYCSGGVLTGETSVRGYKRMRGAAEKSGMRMRIKRKKGLPFFLHSNRKRAGLLAAAVIFAVVMLFLSTRIWSVDVEGNVRLSDDEIITVFEGLGVRTGVPKRKINIKNVQTAAFRQLDVMWLSLNLDGSTAVIEVREINEPSGVLDKNTPCNIVASAEGTVETVEAYVGKAEVKKGDGVRKGSLLVSGVTENKYGTVSIRGAEAYVAAFTEHDYSASVPFERLLQKTEIVRKIYFLRVMGIKIPLGLSFKKTGDCEVYESERYMTSGGKRLPLSIVTKRYAENITADSTLPRDTALLAAYEEIMHRMAEELVNAEINGVAVKNKLSENAAELYVHVDCRENIGRRVKIEYAETGAGYEPEKKQP